MILVISTCKEKLHELEFVNPIKDILRKNNLKFFTKYYSDVNEGDLESSEKIIICGTSLKDDGFLGDVNKFSWIRDFGKPVLGICSGMQIIGLVFGGKLNKETEVGFYYERFDKNFLGLNGDQKVYHLHNNYIDFSELTDFEIFCKSGNITQAVKNKNLYGVLFHPEVRQKELIVNFCKLE